MLYVYLQDRNTVVVAFTKIFKNHKKISLTDKHRIHSTYHIICISKMFMPDLE